MSITCSFALVKLLWQKTIINNFKKKTNSRAFGQHLFYLFVSFNDSETGKSLTFNLDNDVEYASMRRVGKYIEKIGS